MKSRPAVFLLLAVLLGALGSLPAAGQPAAGQPAAGQPAAGQPAAGQPAPPSLAGFALDWVNRFRCARGLAPLAPEPALQRAAAAYAAVLAASGRLSHRDAQGRRVLERYRAAGGSAVRAGEILGAGPRPEAVTAAWEASPAHAAAALDPRWNRVGAGRARGAGGDCLVLMFAEQRVEGLEVAALPGGGYRVAGAFADPGAVEPVLLSGLARVPAAAWDPAGRGFRFLLPAEAGRRYHRLGFLGPAGRFTLAGAFFPEPAAVPPAAP